MILHFFVRFSIIMFLILKICLHFLNIPVVSCCGSSHCASAWSATSYRILWGSLDSNQHLFFSQCTEKKNQMPACQKPPDSALAGIQKCFTIDYFWRLHSIKEESNEIYLNRRKLNYLSHTNFYQMAGGEKSILANKLYILP